MKFQNKSILTFLMLCLFLCCKTQMTQAQSKIEGFLEHFPNLEKKITNQELRKLIETAPNIKYEYQTKIKDELFTTESYLLPVGKIETKKTIILLYAVAEPAYQNDERLMYLHSLSINKKEGKIVDNSVEKYLINSGELSHKKEIYTGKIEFDGTKITFTNQTINQDTGAIKETEIVTYLVGKKMLEFESRK